MGEAQAGLGCDVGERSVAIVAVQHVGAIVVDIQIDVAVVVVVGGCYPDGKSGIAHAGLVGHISESEVAVVAVESILRRYVDLGSLEWSAVREVDVDVTVPVVITKRQSRANIFDDVLLAACAVCVLECDARVFRDVSKHNGCIGRCPGDGT